MDANEFSRQLEQYENTNLTFCGVVANTPVTFAVVNRISLYRVQTLMSKEPETFAWVMGLKPTDVMYDVGANMGLFTILAAKVSGATVVAFEPESQNYALLTRNVYLNEIDDKVHGFCVGVTDRFRMDKLFLGTFGAAQSCHQFGQPTDFNLRPEAGRKFGQGCVGVSLDEVIGMGNLPVPTHLKVDVDGLEHKVLAGARKLLRNRRLVSIIIEINTALPEHRDMFRVLEKNGFSYSREQMEAANCGKQSGDETFNALYNVIFSRV